MQNSKMGSFLAFKSRTLFYQHHKNIRIINILSLKKYFRNLVFFYFAAVIKFLLLKFQSWNYLFN